MSEIKNDIYQSPERSIEPSDFENARQNLLAEIKDSSEVLFYSLPFTTNLESLNDAEQKLVRVLDARPIITWFSSDENDFLQASSSSLSEDQMKLDNPYEIAKLMEEFGVIGQDESMPESDEIYQFFCSLLDEVKIPLPLLQVIYGHDGGQLVLSELPLLKKLNFNFEKVADALIAAGGTKRQLVIHCFEFFRHFVPVKDLYTKLKGEHSSNDLAREFMQLENWSGLCRILEYCSELDCEVASYLILNVSRIHVDRHRNAFKADDEQLNALIVLGVKTYDNFWGKKKTPLSDIAEKLERLARHENKHAIFDFMAEHFNELVSGYGVGMMEAAIKHPEIGAEFVLKEFTKYWDHETYKALKAAKDDNKENQDDEPQDSLESLQAETVVSDETEKVTSQRSSVSKISRTVFFAVLVALAGAYAIDKCSNDSAQDTSLEDSLR